MNTTKKSFNEAHSLFTLLVSGVSENLLPSKPEDVDLRFLRRIRLSDTFDGDSDPVDGLDYAAILYGKQVVWEKYSEYDYGSCIGRTKNGSEMYRGLYFAAQLYLRIQAIGHALYLREKLRKDEDLLYVNLDDFEVLKNHPQFLEMVQDFGLELKPAGKGKHRVVVNKFYER
jgi:hypothetical protein